ncbi:class II aldolase/adducin family protein [Rhizorhabdus histidinilytica]
MGGAARRTRRTAEEHAMASIPSDEARLRQQLTDFYHLVDYFGWSELIFNHISARLPGPDHHYLVNPFGLDYREVRPDNLLVVDVAGNKLCSSNHDANPAGFALHGVIHQNRPDAMCVAHTHSNALSAVAMKRDGFDHNNFYGAQLFGRVGYHDFEGITLYDDERPRMLESLGDKHVLVLRNHGVAVCERDIPTTFMLLWTAQRAAEIQCMAGQAGGADVPLPDEVKQRCAADALRLVEHAQFAELVFDAQVRRMKQQRGW